jgi:hypothetical protein
MEVLECKNYGEMSVTDMIFGRWELPVADYVDIRNRSRISNIGTQTYNAYQYPSHITIALCIFSGKISDDVETMLKFFLHGITYEVVKVTDALGKLQVPIGTVRLLKSFLNKL